MAHPTLLDIVKANAADAAELIDETTKAHPELDLIPSRTIKGIKYTTLVRTSLGSTTGSFRHANQGTEAQKATHENRTVETFILEPRFQVDKAVASGHEDGPEAYIASETQGILEGEMQGLGAQFYYGTSAKGNAKGFPGLLQMHDATNMVVDAAGTTNNTCSSAWLIKFGPGYLQWVWGNNGSFEFSPLRVESKIDPADSTKAYDTYVRTMLARPGLLLANLNAAVRIKKLTADSGKGLTDALISQALAKFPTGIQPDVILCTRRSLQQLQASRTATNPTGAPAPFPTEVVGIAGQNIPIRVTDAISNTETLAL